MSEFINKDMLVNLHQVLVVRYLNKISRAMVLLVMSRKPDEVSRDIIITKIIYTCRFNKGFNSEFPEDFLDRQAHNEEERTKQPKR